MHECVVIKYCFVLFLGAAKQEKYYIGIIDVLTYYGTRKRTAHAAKTVKHGVRLLGNNLKYFVKRFVNCMLHDNI